MRFVDVRPGEHRLFVAGGKGGHQRLVLVCARFFATLAGYLRDTVDFEILESTPRARTRSSTFRVEVPVT